MGRIPRLAPRLRHELGCPVRYAPLVPGIFLEQGDGTLAHLQGEMYESENQLQTLLEKHPELLLGETAEAEGPTSYLLVRRESGVPETVGGSDRWFLDHIFLDREGVPTLVEVKRSTDSRIRREVVGQMLDYAANILAHWPPERMRQEFESRCEQADPSPIDPIQEVQTISDEDYDDYWIRVKTNLAAKRLRLIFVADYIPASLRTIVEFLNEQMRAAEVLAIEVKQHKGDGVTVLTTEVIGRTSTARHTKSVREKREWNEELALEELRRQSAPREEVAVAERFLEWGRGRKLEISWGSGAIIGWGWCVIKSADGLTAGPFGISTNRKFDLYPAQMRRLPPFDQDQVRLDFIRQIATAAKMPIEDKVIDQSFKSFPLGTFSQSYEALIGALDEFVKKTSTEL